MCTIYGYCRVSTAKQSLERQIKNIIKEYPEINVNNIYSDKYTGTTTNRPKWLRLMNDINSGDTIVFDSVSRMSRNADEGIKQYFELKNKGINLVFLKEHYIDTDTYEQTIKNISIASVDTGDSDANKLINGIMDSIKEYQISLAYKQIKIAFEQAEKEVKDIQQRTKEGMAVKNAGEKISESKTNTSYKVKKADSAKEIIRKHYSKFGGSLNVNECMELAKISRNSFFKYVAEIKAE